ncbi:MarR family winged helix-turn-helix transcriptional regulator [Thermoproteota archaeon]
MTSHEVEFANKFLFLLLSLTRHIPNVSHEDIKIGSGVFILSIIDSRENCIMTNIVEDLNLGASTATRQVDTLVKLGLVGRGVSENDRRKVILSLTEKGNRVNNRFKNHLTQVMSSTLKAYSEEDIKKAIEVLNTIVDHSESLLPLKDD